MTLSTINMKQTGLGLAVAVLLDATVVRALLLPAVMQLLGERNWYLPRWRRRPRRLLRTRGHQPLMATTS